MTAFKAIFLSNAGGPSRFRRSSRHTRQHAAQHPFGPASPCAIVVRNDYDAGMVNLLAAFTELQGSKGTVRDFRDPRAALAWIEDVRGEATGVRSSDEPGGSR